ncbi:ATP-utilizing chromatin assembly and remodelling N-terminal-domain-containing protein [Gamsiella multidivaricata]|uniref:ATP-utilizing chromatin assembly and remodelling N-terminal-domain-containing protein n=1 Tax=Gamsiella multidivaricata TaxID=101098 RepID=UPI00222087BC|nr:ATP-utilizing chromatin assembly and remodelling N-terminal-domain-containing protein [Gamsiella multidivaricata]KAG0367850.1 hypothetical protein BGZ54_003149 [Gamsiella multidivaricata]KAI7830596.1 ATP-utilizing chromatin assembly and remodelling N-terminal-domain-containing protein [Gamsiella multidivaricata]
MPLLKRKAIKLVPPPSIDDFEENTPVYMMRFTNEIFTNYEDYINRYFFYKQKNWQCETTGKSGLTYEEALESEHKEKSMVANKFPPQLRKPLLEFVQFQTVRIDAVVDDAFTKFKNVYFQNEPVNVSWDKSTYNAVIRKVLPKEEWTTVQNGAENPEEPGQYLVQVLDRRGDAIEDMQRVVDCSLLSRDRLAFNKNILRKYIRECSSKENYIGAPWLVKPSLAKKYGIETRLPADLQAARDLVFSKLKKRKGPADPAPELAAAKKAKKEAAEKAKEEGTSESATPADVKVIKYPMEDLDLDPTLVAKDCEGPTARPETQKDISVPQDCFEAVVMAWQFLNSFSSALKLSPFGLQDFEDSLAHSDAQHPSVMVAEYHSALLNVIIQDRLKGIAKPVLLSTTGTPTGASAGAREDRESSVMTEDDESTVDDGDLSIGGHDEYIQRRKLPHRPINERVVVIGNGWDEKLVLPPREGWESVLVGLVNELGSFDAIPNVDRILNRLVPNETSLKEDVEFLFPTLPYEDKVSVLVFLVETAAGTSTIRHYMEQCREQLKELRLQKFEINKERRQLQADKAEFERQESADNKSAAALEKAELELQRSAAATPEPTSSHEVDSEAEANGDLSRTESRQEKLKRQQMERELQESRRHQDLLRQRALTKARSAEQKARHDTRKRLADKEHALNRKEEQVDRDVRRFAIARVRPLGKDRFYNRYWYFDGITMDHATDRLYVQSPSFLDLEIVRTRADKDEVLKRQRMEDPSGGLEDLLKTQEQEIIQGLAVERAAREKKLQLERERALDTDDEDETDDTKGPGLANGGTHKVATDDAKEELLDETVPVEHKPTQWSYYCEPEQIDSLLRWLNSKGTRESVLVSALNSHYDLIVGGMQRRHQDLLNQLHKEQHRRSTRTKTVQATEGYLGYVNRQSK